MIHMVSGVQFHSSDPEMNRRFDWAQRQAMAYVRDDAPAGPVYEAALPGREAFCMRDVSHHADGAHAMGLMPHNYNMLRRFACGISESKSYCSFWEIMFDGRPCPVDYADDMDFWYNLPANYDVMDACLRMFRWTGDTRYLREDCFRQFYRMTMREYTARWDRDKDGVIDSLASDGKRGVGSYDESTRQAGYLVAADTLACQYAGCRAYAEILKLSGDAAEASAFSKKAEDLAKWYEDRWWSEEQKAFAAVWFGGNRFGFEFMGTNAIFPLYFHMVSDGRKRMSQLEYVLSNKAWGVEDSSYRPEVLWRHGLDSHARAAWLAMTDPGLSRREYPEVSFTAVGALVTGLMGISPDAAISRVVTRSALHDGEWAQLEGLPLWGGDISLLHDGGTRSTIANHTGRALLWLPEGAAQGIPVKCGETCHFEKA